MTIQMASSVHDRLLRRELGGPRRYSGVKAIYGDKKWVKDLDIINELDGHSGCVNALSWSKNGNLLASGSDDQHVNVHQYLSDDSPNSFRHATSIATGHRANIFSVKFMPHSNDRTIVSAAGDKQIRVFDIEYSGRPTEPATTDVRSSARAQGLARQGVQVLTEADTNARVYRSHSDRVKRIVTESSPHLFLSCSEDGEVRQWDLRQPSSTYPVAQNRHGWLSVTEDDDSGIPPPLISYKRHNLDINTISCSPSQPHYIALGGANPYCFLHDRRMLGRDRHRERGSRGHSGGSSDHDEMVMTEATQCVRRFAPAGDKAKRGGGHVTACKISDANPNEFIASWSGDHIYSFDLVHSPDARDQEQASKANGVKEGANSRVRSSRYRKRKRTQTSDTTKASSSRPQRRRPPAHELERGGNEGVALRVHYENGQSESIPLREAAQQHGSLSEAAEAAMSDADRKPYRIANTSVKIRRQLFTLEEPRDITDQDPTGHARSFTSTLGFAASILEDMDEIIRGWRYPVGPDDVDVALQTTLRRHRESARRFVQAAGTIARVLGGKLQSAGQGSHPLLASFARVQLAPNESRILDEPEQFRYDFIKAICLWLDSGPGAVVGGFTGPRHSSRFPLQGEASIESLDEHIMPYLLRLASNVPIPNVDASRFETQDRRQVFSSERTAVLAFARAIKMPFQDLSDVAHSSSDGSTPSQDRKAALRFWGMRVARGLLLNAGEGVDHSYVDQAFGGQGRSSARVRREEIDLHERMDEVDEDEEDPVVDDVMIEAARPADDEEGQDVDPETDRARTGKSTRIIQDEIIPSAPNASDVEDEGDEDMEEDDSHGDDASDQGSHDDEQDDEESDDEASNMLFRHRRQRQLVNPDVPLVPHHRMYTGHCNVKTVKDVNFYGRNDEYVVSGSDDGNLFIWDRVTSELVNILEGDGEVVNVVQGHPYEPMLAVSGIDSTVKIFGADARARRDARRGIGVSAADDRNFSSLHFGMRRRMAQRSQHRSDANTEDDTSTSEPAIPLQPRHEYDGDVDDSDNADRPSTPENGLSSRRRMAAEYRIRGENDANRQSGQRDTYITRSMLAQLAARMGIGVRRQGGQGNLGGLGGEGAGAGDEDDGEDGDGIPIVIGGGPGGEDGQQVMLRDDCTVM